MPVAPTITVTHYLTEAEARHAMALSCGVGSALLSPPNHDRAFWTLEVYPARELEAKPPADPFRPGLVASIIETTAILALFIVSAFAIGVFP